MADKQIKIGFEVDQTQAAKAKNAIDALTKSMEALAKASAGVSTGKLGGGGMAHAGSPAGQQQKGNGGGIGAKVGGIFRSIIGGDSSETSRLLKTTEKGFSDIQRSVKSFVASAEADVNRLRQSVDGLNKSMGGFSGGGGGGGGGAGKGHPLEGFGGGSGSTGGTSHAELTRGSKDKSGGGVAGGDRRGIIGGWVDNHFQQEANSVGLGGFARSVARHLPFNRAGLGGGVALGAAGIAVGTLAAMEFGASSFNEVRGKQIDYTLNEPLRNQSRRAATAAPFNELHQAVQSKNLIHQVAFQRTLKRPEIMNSLNNVTLRKEAVLAEFDKMGLAAKAGEAYSYVRSAASNGFGSFKDFISGSKMDNATKLSMMQMAENMAIRDMPAEQAGKFRQAIADEQNLMGPDQRMMAQRVYGGALGRIQTMRSLGMSAGTRVRKDGKTVLAYEDEEANLLAGGWTFGDKASGRQALLGVGQGYGKALGPLGIVSAGMGGLTNAAQLLQMGGTISGGVAGAGSFYKGAQSSIGRGGLDVAVGRSLFEYVGQHALQSGQFGGTNGAEQYARAASGLIAGGTEVPLDVGEQQRRFGMLQRGNEAVKGFTGGSAAPLYQATSMMSAMQATGGKWSIATQAIVETDPMVLANIAKGGDVPERWRALGIGQAEAKAHIKGTLGHMFSEVVVDQTTGGSKDVVRDLKARGGDFLGLVKDKVGDQRKGENLKQFQKRRTDAFMDVTGNIAASMTGLGDQESAQGMMLALAASDSEWAPNLKGRGVGAAPIKGSEGDAIKDQASNLHSESELAGAVHELVQFLKGTGGSTAGRKGADLAVRIAAGGQGDIELASTDLIAAITAFTATIKKTDTSKNTGMRVTPLP